MTTHTHINALPRSAPKERSMTPTQLQLAWVSPVYPADPPTFTVSSPGAGYDFTISVQLEDPR